MTTGRGKAPAAMALTRRQGKQMGYKYPKIKDGQWVAPKRKGYRLMCCDCSLVHIFDFKLVPHASGKRIIFRARRHLRATEAARAALLRR